MSACPVRCLLTGGRIMHLSSQTPRNSNQKDFLFSLLKLGLSRQKVSMSDATAACQSWAPCYAELNCMREAHLHLHLHLQPAWPMTGSKYMYTQCSTYRYKSRVGCFPAKKKWLLCRYKHIKAKASALPESL